MVCLQNLKMNRVVNIRKQKYDVYIGRPGPYGNPFQIGRDGDRKQVLQKYKEWFYKKLNDKKFYDKILLLKGKTLGCWCKPLECHGDIIAEYLNNLC